jgi:hypothetical protein
LRENVGRRRVHIEAVALWPVALASSSRWASPGALAGKDGELLAEGEILKEKIVAAAWGVVQERAEQKEIGNEGWPK